MRFRLASIFTIALVVWPLAVAGTAQNPANRENLENLRNPQNLENLENLQQPAETAPAHVAHVEGTVALERDGRPESSPLNMPLLSGDRLKTMDGRVEVLFADGSALHMDARTTIDLQSDDLVRLIDGRLRLNIVSGDARAASARLVYRVDSPAGSIRVTQPGDYRVAILRRAEETQLELAVLRGAAEIFTDEGTTAVRAGERAYASAGLAPSYAYTFNSANWDAFDRWSESRRDTRLGVSSQYLPSEVRAYASTFDEDGDWRYEQSYGYVWYPRVAVGWRPYYYGRWARYPRFGWTWIGADRFAWATHHYGRWGFSVGGWFWIPANRWAPAYVSWAYAPGYVSWCPLGFDNRPVIGINIFNVGPGYYSSRRAWTVVGYSHFGRDYVHRRAVDWDRFDGGRRPSFRVAQTPPVFRDVAVPRSSTTAQRAATDIQGRSTPIRSAGTRSVTPSSDAPRYINRGDEIVRSRAGRPTAPSQRSTDVVDTAPRVAAPRTAPSGPARRVDTPDMPPARVDAPRERLGRDSALPSGPRSPYERGSVAPRLDDPIYQPSPRTYGTSAPRSDDRRAVPRTPPPDAAPPAREPFQAAPSASTPRGEIRPRGGYEPRQAPAAGDRQAPPPRANPAPERSAPSRGVAVPRESAPRSAPPAGAPQGGARPRGGRGGV